MKKQIWISSLIYFISLISACLVNLAVSAIAVKILNLFIVVDYFSAAVTRVIVAFVTVPGVVGAITFYESLKICTSLLLAGIYHLAISTLLMFYPFIAGGTRYLAGIINMGSRFDSSNRVEDIYLWAYLGAFGIYLITEIAVAVACGYFGKRKRLENRKLIDGYVNEP